MERPAWGPTIPVESVYINEHEQMWEANVSRRKPRHFGDHHPAYGTKREAPRHPIL
jgi:hypothetical protein